MTRAGSMVVFAFAAVGAGCMGTTHASRAAAPAPQAATPQSGMGNMMAQCPMAVPGAQVAAADTTDGEAVTFTTTSPDAVADLRSRVQAMADMHNRLHAGGQAGMMQGGQSGMQGGMGEGSAGTEPEGSAASGDSGQMQGGQMQGGQMQGGMGQGAEGSAGAGGAQGQAGMGSGGMGGMMPPPSRAVVEDVDGGARLTVTPNDPADLDRLRTAVRTHVDRMQQTGGCGMSGRMMQQP